MMFWLQIHYFEVTKCRIHSFCLSKNIPLLLFFQFEQYVLSFEIFVIFFFFHAAQNTVPTYKIMNKNILYYYSIVLYHHHPVYCNYRTSLNTLYTPRSRFSTCLSTTSPFHHAHTNIAIYIVPNTPRQIQIYPTEQVLSPSLSQYCDATLANAAESIRFGTRQIPF